FPPPAPLARGEPTFGPRAAGSRAAAGGPPCLRAALINPLPWNLVPPISAFWVLHAHQPSLPDRMDCPYFFLDPAEGDMRFLEAFCLEAERTWSYWDFDQAWFSHTMPQKLSYGSSKLQVFMENLLYDY
uniref:Uncharacterized protein n=1 Tax=Oryzias latipes TaxID=8090 RepID=A0A3P9M9I2_ORYLA